MKELQRSEGGVRSILKALSFLTSCSDLIKRRCSFDGDIGPKVEHGDGGVETLVQIMEGTG